jgi:hypothetical protein
MGNGVWGYFEGIVIKVSHNIPIANRTYFPVGLRGKRIRGGFNGGYTVKMPNQVKPDFTWKK